MLRFVLFTYDQYYPRGGWGDFNNNFGTLEEAMDAAAKSSADNKQIVDLKYGKIVWEN